MPQGDIEVLVGADTLTFPAGTPPEVMRRVASQHKPSLGSINAQAQQNMAQQDPALAKMGVSPGGEAVGQRGQGDLRTAALLAPVHPLAAAAVALGPSGRSALGSDLWGMAKGSVIPPPVAFAQNALESLKSLRETGKTPEQLALEQRRAEGRSLPYSALAVPAAEGLGVNVSGMEQAAAQGDTSGVLGHAAAVPTFLAATYGVAQGVPKMAEMARSPGPAIARAAIEQTLRPPPKAFRFGKDPVGFVIDNGITANSLPEFTKAIEQTVEAKKADLSAVLKDAPPVDLKPAAKLARDAIDRSIRARSVKLTDQLAKFYEDRFGGGQTLTVSAADAADIRHGIQAETNWGTDSPGLNSIRKQVQHEIGEAVHKAEPKSIPLDEQVSSGIEAAKAAKVQELAAEAGRRPVRFGARFPLAGSMIGGGIGGAIGGPAGAGVGAAAGGAIARTGLQALAEPVVSTRVARVLRRRPR
jgi:hypothetical protein